MLLIRIGFMDILPNCHAMANLIGLTFLVLYMICRAI